MTIGELVHSYRVNNKMTMQEFADRCGLSKGYISMLEKGKHPQNARLLVPSVITLKKIASALGLDIKALGELLDDGAEITINDPTSENLGMYMCDDLIRISSAWGIMSEEDKAIIKIIADKYR